MFPGSAVNSPDDSFAPSAPSPNAPTSPSDMAGPVSPDANPASSASFDPKQRLESIFKQSMQIEDMLNNWAMNFPASGKSVQEAQSAIRKALQQILATAVPGQEPPTPAMLG